MIANKSPVETAINPSSAKLSIDDLTISTGSMQLERVLNIVITSKFWFPNAWNVSGQAYPLEIWCLFLEIDSRYWHDKNYSRLNDIDKRVENDILKNDLAKNNGYRLIRIWDDELNKEWRII